MLGNWALLGQVTGLLVFLYKGDFDRFLAVMVSLRGVYRAGLIVNLHIKKFISYYVITNIM